MGYELDGAGTARVEGYFERIGQHLKDWRKRESFAIYALGILGDGERKSAEPIACRACATPEYARGMHEKLLHFVGESRWDDRAVRRESAMYAIEQLQKREPVTTWVVDDTGFLKQGRHSPGVQRQYTGSAGKIANCQIGVSLSIATPTEHLPIDFELYLPQSWIDDPVRRKRSRIPGEIAFQTKVQLAMGMLRRAAKDGIPGELVLADSFYGRSWEFRETIRDLGLDYAVAVDSDTRVWLLDAKDRRKGEATEVGQLGRELGKASFRRVTWRSGSKSTLSSRFCFRRVKVVQNDGAVPTRRESVWLMWEWPEGEASPTKFVLTTLPRRLSKTQIVRLTMERCGAHPIS
jgi:SRSO17 transposase